MSLYTNQVSANSKDFFFLLANVSTLTTNNLIAKNISTNSLLANTATISSLQTDFISSGRIHADFIDVHSISSLNLEANYFENSTSAILFGNISSITTNNITLDGNTIDTGGVGFGAVLLLNGLPIATGTSSFSSIQEWSYFPALSTVHMGNFNIEDAGNITCQNIYNALNIQTDTLNALTAMTAPSGTVTNLRTTNFSTVNAVGSNISISGNANFNNISTGRISGQSGTFGGLSTLAISTGSINGTPFISGSNWSQYPANSAVNFNGYALTNTTGQTFSITPSSNLNITTSNGNLVANYPIALRGGDITVTADGGSDVGNNATVNLVASNGNRGQINLTANPGFAGVQGEVNVTANGGTVGGVGLGGLITLTANTPIGLSNLTSAIKLSAAGINSYAGATPSFGSGAGYNFIHGDLGVNITSGLASLLPNTAGTTYIYGTAGVEIPSDAYMKYITPYWDGLTTPPDLKIEGRYILPNLAQVCVRMSNVKQIDFQENFGTYMSNCDNIGMSSNGVITTSNLGATNATIGTLSNTNIVGAGGSLSGYTNISGTNGSFTTLSNTNIVGSGAGTISGYNQINSSNANLSSIQVSSINSFASFGTKSMRVEGDVAQIQLRNNNIAGAGTNLNLLSRTAYSEIQSFNSNFTTPLNLIFNADNFGFNVPSASITGGIEMDISGNTQVRGDLYVTGTEYVSTIANLKYVNTKDIYTFGEFLTLSTITITGANTPTVIPFDTNTVGNEVSLVSGAIEVSQSGLYEFKVSIQFDKSGGGTDVVDFWVRVNGNDVANTASQLVVNGTQGETLGTCFYYLSLNASDKVEIVFASGDATMEAAYFPAWVTPGDPYDRPAVPAVIANIKLLR
jgi:hypothetical protein